MTSMIYYVEDDTNIRDLTVYALKQSGFEARGFAGAAEFFDACEEETPELVLLDIMLPEVDGMEILRRLRADEETHALPIMMLTAKGTEFDKVCGLDAGADDYLAKPFGMMELVSRVNALLRRANAQAAAVAEATGEGAEGESDAGSGGSGTQATAASRGVMAAGDEELTAGPIVLSSASHTVEVGGTLVSLTLKEFDLLRALMRNEGRVLTRAQLLEDVWGITYVGETRTVDVHIQTLRQKLARTLAGTDALITTVRGVGYCLKVPAA